MDVVIFGAGMVGHQAEKAMRGNVRFFIDNDPEKWGKRKNGIEIISLDQYIQEKMQYQIAIAVGRKNRSAIKAQLESCGIENYTVFDSSELLTKERIISYCQPGDMEDVILYHVLKGENNIFYIDVGSNDPFSCSVTKLLYDRGARGINIEPLELHFRHTQAERPRDINLCVGIGKEESKKLLYIQGGLSTLMEENVVENGCKTAEIDIVTLKSVCERYVDKDQTISFLKIDVEGAERDVLEGADFSRYRPKIIVIEATLPNTNIPCYDKWEDILLDNHYHYVYAYGCDRYYVADECGNLDEKFQDIDTIDSIYNIYQAKLTFIK